MLFKFIEESRCYLDSKNDDLEAKKIKVEKLLSKELEKFSFMIQSRVKTSKSLKEKILRKNYHVDYETGKELIDDLSDLIGIRLVCVLKQEEEEFQNYFINHSSYNLETSTLVLRFQEDETCILEIDCSNQPETQKNGHKIYKYKCKWRDSTGVTYVELQIKSLIHMFWGEIEHMIVYKNYSYQIDDNFYNNIMNSTYKLLEGIDDQLLALSEHLKEPDEESKKIIENRQIITKIVAATYQKIIVSNLDSNIDLRGIYKSIVMLFTYKTTDSQELLKISESLIGKANDFCFDKETIMDTSSHKLLTRGVEYRSLADENKRIIKAIDKLINQPDLFWKIFIELYMHLSGQDYTMGLVDISKKTLEMFNSLLVKNVPQDKEDEYNFGLSVFSKSILNIFEEYKKSDIFVEFEQLNDFIIEFIKVEIFKLSEDKFSDLESPSENLINLYARYFSIKSLVILNKLPSKNILKEFYDLIAENSDKYPERLDYNKFIEYKEQDDYNLDYFLDVLNFSEEDGKDD